jgi:predicted DNA-binding protein YlxM (UPF0122 family)
MKFNELDESDKLYICETYYNRDLSWDERIAGLSEKFECSTRTIANWITKLNLNAKTVEESPQLKLAQSREYNKKTKRFIITWAQNNTPVHTDFLNNIKAYAEFINADLHVIAGRYKNPTSIWSTSQE